DPGVREIPEVDQAVGPRIRRIDQDEVTVVLEVQVPGEVARVRAQLVGIDLGLGEQHVDRDQPVGAVRRRRGQEHGGERRRPGAHQSCPSGPAAEAISKKSSLPGPPYSTRCEASSPGKLSSRYSSANDDRFTSVKNPVS